jgi:3-oxoacyl-[acyl-carrier protein] reductase
VGNLLDKVAFVSGGNAGIGKEIAVRLAELGADIAFTWHSHPADEVVEEIKALGRRVLPLQVDVTRSSAVLDTNLSSAFYLVRSGLVHMADGGPIVLMSSLAARTGGGAGAGAYAAAKAGMLGLARALAKEVASRGIAVNAVCPGFIQGTPFHARFTPADDQQATIARLPVGRGGSPADVAELVAYLAAGSTNFLTGQAITVSGGQELV